MRKSTQLLLLCLLIALITGCSANYAGKVNYRWLIADKLTVQQGGLDADQSVFVGPTALPTATPVLVVDQYGVGVIQEWRDAATPVAQINDGGDWQFEGNKLDLDADEDTSVTADTDDQIDIEIGGTDTVVLKSPPAANASGNIAEVQFTAPAHTTGTYTVNGLVLDVAAGQSISGASHLLNALQIDGITGDVTTTETAINIGSGWDVDLNLQNGETIVNSYNGVITATATTFHVQGNETASGSMTAGTGFVATTEIGRAHV